MTPFLTKRYRSARHEIPDITPGGRIHIIHLITLSLLICNRVLVQNSFGACGKAETNLLRNFNWKTSRAKHRQGWRSSLAWVSARVFVSISTSGLPTCIDFIISFIVFFLFSSIQVVTVEGAENIFFPFLARVCLLFVLSRSISASLPRASGVAFSAIKTAKRRRALCNILNCDKAISSAAVELRTRNRLFLIVPSIGLRTWTLSAWIFRPNRCSMLANLFYLLRAWQRFPIKET